VYNVSDVSTGLVDFILKDRVVEIYSNPWTGPEGSRRMRLPDFKTIGT
jgi:hypothetical protein